MRKLLRIFFEFLGVIFFILILAGAYLYIADPFEIKPLIKLLTSPSSQIATTTSSNSSNKTATDKNPLLTQTQEQTLEKIGVDPTSLPSSITPEMKKCFYEKLGTKRADEIKNGSEPTTSDFFIARGCL